MRRRTSLGFFAALFLFIVPFYQTVAAAAALPDCLVCDGPGLPAIGQAALASSKQDAYIAVDKLLPAAAGGDVDAQISIAFIMNYWLTKHLKGSSPAPFTWRETWSWYLISAQNSPKIAEYLGAAYVLGEHGLKKNKQLGECLELKDGRPTKVRVAECFRRYSQ